jgi:hypothetical protein
MGIRVGGRWDADRRNSHGRNARGVGRDERIGKKGGELFASGPLFFVDDFADGVAHNGVGTAGTLGAKKAGDALGGEQGGGTSGARHGCLSDYGEVGSILSFGVHLHTSFIHVGQFPFSMRSSQTHSYGDSHFFRRNVVLLLSKAFHAEESRGLRIGIHVWLSFIHSGFQFYLD